MKIIAVDNVSDGSDILICENVNNLFGKFFTEQLNGAFTLKYASRIYKLVEDDYELYKDEN